MTLYDIVNNILYICSNYKIVQSISHAEFGLITKNPVEKIS